MIDCAWVGAIFDGGRIGCLDVALRSFGVLWTPQDDNGYLAKQMAKPRQSSMVIAPEQPQPATNYSNVSS